MNILVLLQNVQGIGGTNLLLKKYAKWMHKNKNCFVYESTNGIVDEQYKKINWDLVVLATSEMSTLIKLKMNFINFNKILVWSFGQGSFLEAYLNGKIYSTDYNIIHKIILNRKNALLKYLINKKSIIISDEPGLNFELKDLKNINIDKNKFIYPIIIDKEDRLYFDTDKDKNNNLIRLTWVGRVDRDFKYMSILRLIQDIEKFIKLNNTIKIKLTIIGKGEVIDNVLEILNKSSVEFNHIPFVEYEKLHTTIVDCTDILFAMGTSALDGAKIGIPTVIIHPLRENQTHYPLYPYRWIFETKGYTMGEMVDRICIPEQIAKNFETIIDDFTSIKDLSTLSYKYVDDFDINIVLTRLWNNMEQEKIDIYGWIMLFELYLLNAMKKLIKKLIRYVG